MTFALPWLFAAGVAGASIITVLHFLSVQRPPELLLPTARFLDEGVVRAVSRSTRPNDLWVLLLRVAALLAACTALAGPRWRSRSGTSVRVVVADVAMRSDSAVIRRAVDSLVAVGDVRFVWTDSATRSGAVAQLRRDLAAAIPLGVREATRIAATMPSVDSVSLFVVPPTAGYRISSDGWRTWHSAWPARISVVSTVRSGAPSNGANRTAPVPVQLQFDSVGPNDPVQAAFERRRYRRGNDVATSVLVQRSHAEMNRDARARRDSAIRVGGRVRGDGGARGDGDVTVVWPSDGRPAGWTASADSVTAIVARGVAMLGTRSRLATYNSQKAQLSDDAMPIAWWSDGEVAALEERAPNGCVRTVAIPTAVASDLLLDATADGLFDALLAKCTHLAMPPSVPTDTMTERSIATSAFRQGGSQAFTASPTWLPTALLVLALLLLGIETVVRRGGDISVNGGAA